MGDESWKQIWERKGNAANTKVVHDTASLFAADGFDSPLGKTSEESWRHISDTIRRNLKIEQGQRLLEVGCGAGAVLALLADTGARMSGVDFSAPHVEIARRALPEADFQVAEARSLPFADSKFDRVLSHGVFLYFPDLAYAEACLLEILRVSAARAKILIMDNPDAAKREQALAARRAAFASLLPEQLYFPKAFFEEFAAAHRLRATIFNQQVPGYANAPFRFNALLER